MSRKNRLDSVPKQSLEVLTWRAHPDAILSLFTGSAAVMATSDVGSAALCSHSRHPGAFRCALVRRARLFRCRCAAFRRTKILNQIAQNCVAVGVGDDCAQAFHFYEFVRPLLAGKVLLRDAAHTVASRAIGLQLGLHRSRWKRLAGSAGRLRTGHRDGCEQKKYRK